MENVEQDVREGYVTVDAARNLYGVVVDEQSLEADADASEKLRSARQALAEAEGGAGAAS